MRAETPDAVAVQQHELLDAFPVVDLAGVDVPPLCARSASGPESVVKADATAATPTATIQREGGSSFMGAEYIQKLHLGFTCFNSVHKGVNFALVTFNTQIL